MATPNATALRAPIAASKRVDKTKDKIKINQKRTPKKFQVQKTRERNASMETQLKQALVALCDDSARMKPRKFFLGDDAGLQNAAFLRSLYADASEKRDEDVVETERIKGGASVFASKPRTFTFAALDVDPKTKFQKKVRAKSPLVAARKAIACLQKESEKTKPKASDKTAKTDFALARAALQAHLQTLEAEKRITRDEAFTFFQAWNTQVQKQMESNICPTFIDKATFKKGNKREFVGTQIVLREMNDAHVNRAAFGKRKRSEEASEASEVFKASASVVSVPRVYEGQAGWVTQPTPHMVRRGIVKDVVAVYLPRSRL